jgi:hypothetical protein
VCADWLHLDVTHVQAFHPLCAPSLVLSPRITLGMDCVFLVLIPQFSDRQICHKCGPGEEAIRLVVDGTFIGRCRPCPAGEYNSATEGKCTPCPSMATTLHAESASPTDCVCTSGYTTGTGLPYALTACKACDSTLVCPGGGTPESAAAGHFLTSRVDHLETRPCWPQVACSSNGTQNCSAGYAGWMCAQCASGHQRRKRIAGLQAAHPYCLPCEKGAVVGFVGVLLLHFGAIAAWLLAPRPAWLDSTLLLGAFTVHGVYLFSNLDLRWTGQFTVVRNAFGIESVPMDSRLMSGVLYTWVSRGLAPLALVPSFVDAAVPVCSPQLASFATFLTVVALWTPGAALAYKLYRLLFPIVDRPIEAGHATELKLESRLAQLVLLQFPVGLVLIGALMIPVAIVVAVFVLPVLVPWFRRYEVTPVAAIMRPFVRDFGGNLAWGVAPATAHSIIALAIVFFDPAAPTGALVVCMLVLLAAMAAVVYYEPYSTERGRTLAPVSLLVQCSMLIGGVLMRGGHVGTGDFVAVLGCVVFLHGAILWVSTTELHAWWSMRGRSSPSGHGAEQGAGHGAEQGVGQGVVAPDGTPRASPHAMSMVDLLKVMLSTRESSGQSPSFELVQRQVGGVVDELRPVLKLELDAQRPEWLAILRNLRLGSGAPVGQQHGLRDVPLGQQHDLRGDVAVLNMGSDTWNSLVEVVDGLLRILVPLAGASAVSDELNFRLLHELYNRGLLRGWHPDDTIFPYTMADGPGVVRQQSPPVARGSGAVIITRAGGENTRRVAPPTTSMSRGSDGRGRRLLTGVGRRGGMGVGVRGGRAGGDFVAVVPHDESPRGAVAE